MFSDHPEPVLQDDSLNTAYGILANVPLIGKSVFPARPRISFRKKKLLYFLFIFEKFWD